ncbi:MAG: endonuclease/exonuclease/phosphatase family protein [Myxococcota bacterium]
MHPSSLRLWLPLGLVFLSLGCRALPRDLGSLPGDQTQLAEVPVLKHLEAASQVKGASAHELVSQKKWTFESAPDPSAYIQARAAEAASLPPLEQSVDLSVLTYNVAWLDFKILWKTYQSPRLADRRAAIVAGLFGEHDVVMVQEAWAWTDAQMLGEAAEAAGYAWYAGTPDRHSQHGLFVAVKLERIGRDQPLHGEEHTFFAQRQVEWFPGPKVRRGWLQAHFELAGTGRTVHLVDLHATSFPSFYRVRELQARQVGQALEAVGDDSVVLMGGDFNSGPFYVQDEWTHDNGKSSPGWWRNATAWALWQHYGHVDDVQVLTGQAIDDVQRGKGVHPRPPDDFCQVGPGHTFSASDCNSLYKTQYGGTEYPARLDFIFLGDPGQNVRVQNTGLRFVAPVDVGVGEPVEWSDHYGFEAMLKVRAEGGVE